MKAVILAGGLGTRISEETTTKPKPMVGIGEHPILWHIMKHYSQHGINDFIICLGYKGYVIKEYFANYFLHMSDITLDIQNNQCIVHSHEAENWRITLVNTGQDTMTGGRLKRVQKYLDNEDFCFTYGDGVSNIDITAQIAFHQAHGKKVTIGAVRPPGRFGALNLSEDTVFDFSEKPDGDGDWINGGFFILNPSVIDRIDNDQTIWEKEPITHLAHQGEVKAFFHHGFWQPMDTLRDKMFLENLWLSKKAPWKTWKD